MAISHFFDSKIASCEDIINYTFQSKILCALNAAADFSAHVFTNGIFKLPRNDRLAVYGDSIADFHLCDLWYEQGPARSKGQWSAIRKDVLGNDNLAHVGFEHGLDKCVVLNGGTYKVSKSMMATAVEAILGAVHKDGGNDGLVLVMRRLGLTQHAHLPQVLD
ncbi:ribonuclease III domain-containing protein [Pseudomassariella vexata]|uniref:Ribonuclease III domain-containing protein n=1 Tax=Pseudomassariella vexata TaxID=1141098 RepID=A0A1Y2D9G5_9PEZI|nr:ribonuclease III domain-containing protein [Pseudomassariella vexata]ORY55847.1 ribonuclease III domain-containing protein [Pseudomassariella vexata]